MSQIVSAPRRIKRREERRDDGTPPAPFSTAIGRSRYIVLLAVVAVMLIAMSLFVLGAIQAIVGVWDAWVGAVEGGFRRGEGAAQGSTSLTVEFLEIVSVMLKAVVFYLIGVGLYSLFISPLNLTVSLGVETLNDLESKVISVVVVIMSVTFLEHFIRWEDPLQTLQFGGALALVVLALVLFQMYSHRAKEDQQSHHPDVQARAKRELFQEDHEEHTITSDQIAGVNDDDGNR
jgi:uncharacterized membrane protein YqhA